MNGYADSLLRLPGTAAEKIWLEEHLEMLSVREGIVLAAAMERSPPVNMADAVNCLLTLDGSRLCPADNYEQLGEFYLLEQCVPQEQKPFFDKAALGQWYAEEHPGLFMGGYYVTFPDKKGPMPYDGHNLPSDFERWSVRLKLASEAVPDGVWIRLPDYDEMYDEPAGDFRLALDALRVKMLNECTLLDARCSLPCIQNLASQYDSLGDLVYDGQNLGIVLDERGQGSPDYLDRFFAALEYEGCRRLDDALHIAEELNSYDIIQADAFLDNAMLKLSRQLWAQDGEDVKNCFDYVAYAEALAAKQGYRLTDDRQMYIRNRDSPTMEPQQSGMTMQ